MATVNRSVIKANIFVLLPSLEGVHCQLQLRSESMKAIRIPSQVASLRHSYCDASGMRKRKTSKNKNDAKGETK